MVCKWLTVVIGVYF